VNPVQKRGQVGDDPADLFFPNLPVEDLLEDSGPFFFGRFSSSR